MKTYSTAILGSLILPVISWAQVAVGGGGGGGTLGAPNGSFLGTEPGDALLVTLQADAGYQSATGNLTDSSHAGVSLVRDQFATGGSASTQTALVTPPVGTGGKDMAQGSASFSYTVGAPDVMTLSFSAQASAVTAQVGTPLANADALVHLELTMVIPNNGGGGPPTFDFTLPALPVLGATESITDKLTTPSTGGLVTVVSRSTGGAPVAALTETLNPLLNYTYTVDYTMDVPFGTDPSGGANLTASLTAVAVPEPGAESIAAAAGLAALYLGARWRRRAGARA